MIHESQRGIVQHITIDPPATVAIADAIGMLLSNRSLTSSLYSMRLIRDPQQMMLRVTHENAKRSSMKYVLIETTSAIIVEVRQM